MKQEDGVKMTAKDWKKSTALKYAKSYMKKN